MKRFFSEKQKLAVELVTGQQGDGDHIDPFINGGETDVVNCQLLSKPANSKKGKFVFEPREWQVNFFKKWDEREINYPFLLIAIPGGGKTYAALEVARKWRQAGTDRRIVVVVPTDNLRTQWQDEAFNFGIELQTKEFGTNFKDGFQGGVTTFSYVANHQEKFRKLCAVAPTMVIFDEVHHCGDETYFGEGIKKSFELAKEKLLMSGTPWKSDGKQIPFVRYDGNGYAIGDFNYDYPTALIDDVVRHLVFDYTKGEIRNDVTGKVEVVNKDITDTEASKRLTRLLAADGDFVADFILAAHEKLLEYRKEIPDAAALAVCIDQFHALQVSKVIKRVTGCTPSLIVSDGEIENDTVKGFRKSSLEWLVSVKKVSEGTDIKRLQVLCYLTNVTTDLFFRQVIGRVSRVREMDDNQAFIYLPADPRLIECAINIENAQGLALKTPITKDPNDFKRDDNQPYQEDSYSTRNNGTDIVIIGGVEVNASNAKRIELIAEKFGVPMQKALAIDEYYSSLIPIQITTGHHEHQETTLEDRIDKLRTKCKKTAFKLSMKIGCHVRDIHKRFKPQKDMSESELQEKLESLIDEYNSDILP